MDTRIFVHKKEQFQVESESLAAELRQSLSLKEDFGLTKYNLYDIFDADENDGDYQGADGVVRGPGS